jgi:hypothetical protein
MPNNLDTEKLFKWALALLYLFSSALILLAVILV